MILLPSNQPHYSKNDYSYKIACSQPQLCVFMCEEEQARKKKNKNREKVNNSQKSMILRKFLFLVEFVPSDYLIKIILTKKTVYYG